MPDLIFIAGAAIVFVATQIGKHASRDVNPLWIAAGVSLLGGVGYATLLASGHWEAVRDFALVAFSGAVAIHNVMKQAIDAMNR